MWGLLIGARALDDNSFFTHLATGRLILESGIPSSDPYSFTAPSASWTVQSWLVSLVLGAADRVAGGLGVHLVIMALTTTIACLVWSLTRPARSLLARLGLAAMVVGVGAGTWAERPLLVGLVGLCLVVLAAEDRLDPRWLVPIMWVWVNSHGSFPLALVALGTYYVGRRLDGEPGTVERRALLWAVVGLVAGAIGPLGPRVLLFPVELLSHSEALSNVVEWTSPGFESSWDRLFLLQVVVAILLLVRKPSYRAAVPTVVFLVASLLAVRNVSVASIVLLPGMAAACRGLGRLDGAERSWVLSGSIGVVALLGLALVGATVSGPTYELGRYPVAAVAWMEDNGLATDDRRVAHQDSVGNFLELVKGTDANVFFDDRFDMYPLEVVKDYESLLNGDASWSAVLDEYDVDTVLWGGKLPLAQLLLESPDWQIAYRDPSWIVACRRGTCP